MKNKYICIILAVLSLFCVAHGTEKPERSPMAHMLNFGYSPVLRSSYYREWKPVPPLKFSLNYTYDIPMRSRVVNFYAIGEVSYIGALHKDIKTVLVRDVPQKVFVKNHLNAVILSAGMGLKVHLASFLDLAFFYTGGYFYTDSKYYTEGLRNEKGMMHDYSGCAGIRFIGKIGKINVFAGYSFAHSLSGEFYNNLYDNANYIDIGIGYTF